MLTLELIKEAHARIKPVVHRTPVITSRSFDEIAAQVSGQSARQVFFKCENLQRAGAFKARGAMNKILSLNDEERRRGVVAFSSGNHAQAVALAAREVGTRAVIVMPQDAPQMKVAGTRGYGAQIIFFDRQCDDREQITRDIAEREHLTLIPPYDDYLVMAGQGTCALELLEDVPDLDCLVTPCSGGGLFAGTSTVVKALKPEARCFPVEPETGNDTLLSIEAGRRVEIPPPPTIADGARVQSPGALTFPITERNAEKVLTVSDAEIIAAMRFILLRLKLLVEPTGALGAAAVLSGKLPTDARKIGVVLSGGNVDPDSLSRYLAPQNDNDGV
jgi:threonine dehydratase